MPTTSMIDAVVLSPLGSIGRFAIAGVTYMGELGMLCISALRAFGRTADEDTPLHADVGRHLSTMLLMGMPLVGLVHVGIGSFLSMQAYFGGTFVDGTGAVVGVGLVRNVAPLMTGLTLAGLFAAQMTSELRNRTNRRLGPASNELPDRGVSRIAPAVSQRPPDPARRAAVRITAALAAGPILSFWGIAVGTVVGWQTAKSVLGVSTHTFYSMFFEMLWMRDVVGAVIKGMAFGLFAAVFACHEGLRGPIEPDPESVPAAACRAACLASVAMLVLSSGWFLLFYHAGAPFGPTLLDPPAA